MAGRLTKEKLIQKAAVFMASDVNSILVSNGTYFENKQLLDRMEKNGYVKIVDNSNGRGHFVEVFFTDKLCSLVEAYKGIKDNSPNGVTSQQLDVLMELSV
ncbi:MAG: hypothetical protein QW318_07485 [Candidatus Caldarchaeum sp.]